MKRNLAAGALRRRAGNAGTAVAVDTRPRIVKPRRGRASYDRTAAARADRRDRDETQKPPKGGFFHGRGIGDKARQTA